MIVYDEGELEAKLLCGVRQGWPLSPLLFLCVIDELIGQLKPDNGYLVGETACGRVHLTGCAFADDLILYSSSPTGMMSHLAVANTWCNDRGLKINANKSTCLYLDRVPREKRVRLARLDLKIGEDAIPDVDNFERLLGVHIHNTGRRDLRIDNFTRDLNLICESRLRPTQKLSVIRDCLVPMIKYRLVYGFATLGSGATIDKIIRKRVKLLMHLPKFTSNATLYCSLKEGGFGFEPLREVVQIEQALLVKRMFESGNAVTRMLANTAILNKLGLNFNLDMRTINGLKKDMAEKRHEKFMNTTQGDGWHCFLKAPRAFIDEPRKRGWRDRDVVDVAKMRSNVLATRALMARTVGRGGRLDLRCRGCGCDIETQAHILSRCSTTQGDRVARHDSVCNYVSQRLNRVLRTDGVTIEREYSVRIRPGECSDVPTGRELRPDLAVTTSDRIVLIEVSVVYESGNNRLNNSLALIRRRKLDKYRPLKRVLFNRTGKQVFIKPLIVGCRGGWLKANNTIFNQLGVHLTDLDKQAIVERAVRGSLVTFNRFNRRQYASLLAYSSN